MTSGWIEKRQSQFARKLNSGNPEQNVKKRCRTVNPMRELLKSLKKLFNKRFGLIQKGESGAETTIGGRNKPQLHKYKQMLLTISISFLQGLFKDGRP